MTEQETPQGYYSPNGVWYKNSKAEITHLESCLEFEQEGVEAYQRVGNWIFKPALIYGGIRFLGLAMGIGPEIDAVEPSGLDIIAGTTILLGGIAKVCEVGAHLAVRSAKKELVKGQERLGIVPNGA